MTLEAKSFKVFGTKLNYTIQDQLCAAC